MTATDIHAEVTRTARELYYSPATDGSAGYRDLETFEALFISAVNSIQSGYAKERGDALRTWGRGAAYEAICNMTARSEAKDLTAALAAYKAERERFYNFDEDEVTERVAVAMAAE